MARSHESLWLTASGAFTAVAVALLTANATLDAVRPQYAFWTSGLMVLAYVMGVLAIICFVGAMRQWAVPLSGDRPHRGAAVEPEAAEPPVDLATTEAGPVITDRWQQTSDGGQVPALMNLTHIVMFHPGYGGRQTQETPPSVKIGMLVACQPLDPAASGTELRAKFAAFLETDPVRKLIGSLMHVDPGMSWKNLAGNGPVVLEAALTAGANVLDGVPVASALLLPPMAGMARYGRDGRCATLLIYVEPRTVDNRVPPASGLRAWYERFGLALAVPGAFAEFLAKDLGLGTSDDPPAQVGIWLQSHQPLTTMVDVQGLKMLPGSSPSNQFIGWAFAAPDGSPEKRTARDLLSQLCEYSLHLDDFEQRLEEISTAARSPVAVESTWERRDLPVLAVAVRLLDEAATGQVRVSAVAGACGLDLDEVASAVQALDGTYLKRSEDIGRHRYLGRQSGDGCCPPGCRPVAGLTCRRPTVTPGRRRAAATRRRCTLQARQDRQALRWGQCPSRR